MADLPTDSNPIFRLPTIGSTVLLEASAGTGKTHQIASLVCRYVKEGSATIDQILLVTFGNAATAELRSRVYAELSNQAKENDAPPDNLARLRAALESFDEATIATTHTFCSLMLRQLGILANWDADARFTDNLSELISEVVEDLYLLNYANETEPPFSLDQAKAIGSIVIEHGDDLYQCNGHAHELAFAKEVRRLVRYRKARAGVYTYDDLIDQMLDTIHDPVTGEFAKQRLADKFPVVLVDEFQDTDPQQWSILKEAFVDRSCVILIGDPKQSIYGFRNADLNSYLEARSQADTHYRLTTNWRSDPGVVEAMNSLFRGLQMGAPQVEVSPVGCARSSNLLARSDGHPILPVRIRTALPTSDQDLDQARELVHADLVNQITDLLTEYQIAGKAVRPGDIAVLVRQRDQADTLSKLLNSVGIPAVFPGSKSVFATQAAKDWLKILNAWHLATPSSIRAAALTSIVGVSVDRLAAEGDLLLDRIAADLHAGNLLAHESGIFAAWLTLSESFNTHKRLVSDLSGEAMLTDLRHLVELMSEAQWHENLTVEGVRTWLSNQIDRLKGANDTTSRRLATDDDAVQILTMHGAKGLQFPIVLAPSVSEWVTYGEKRPFTFSLNGHRQVFVGGVPERASRWKDHLEEMAAEELRLLYVAFTRAVNGIIAWWSPSRLTSASPLHRLLSRNGSPRPQSSYPLSAAKAWPVWDGVRIEPIPDIRPLGQQRFEPAKPIGSLGVRKFDRAIDQFWRRTSYSALTSESHDFGKSESDEPDLDELFVEAPSDLETTVPMAALPGGTAFGSLVHLVLEKVNWSRDELEASLDSILDVQLRRQPDSTLDRSMLKEGLTAALTTPLGELSGGLALADIPVKHRLAELDFDLPLGTRRRSKVSDLAQAMAAHLPRAGLLADYPRRLASSPAAENQLCGFLTGSIDAVLKVDQRYLVIDYKTNSMPREADQELSVGHYRPLAMAEAMMASHYPLQALLYSVALHRFLSWRLPNYDPASHLGGVGYLFVRGMIGPRTPVVGQMPCGVFTWYPGPDLVIEASNILGGRSD